MTVMTLVSLVAHISIHQGDGVQVSPVREDAREGHRGGAAAAGAQQAALAGGDGRAARQQPEAVAQHGDQHSVIQGMYTQR